MINWIKGDEETLSICEAFFYFIIVPSVLAFALFILIFAMAGFLARNA
tara:strand:+ start:301 stop:444 length:144 start_codon:yes stop_codon:yes gene_type:complete